MRCSRKAKVMLPRQAATEIYNIIFIPNIFGPASTDWITRIPTSMAIRTVHFNRCQTEIRTGSLSDLHIWSSLNMSSELQRKIDSMPGERQYHQLTLFQSPIGAFMGH